MDLVYICKDGDNEELRYSIRSAVENLPHDNIWVFGGKPDWYIGNYVRLKQNSNKFDNARANLASVARHSDVSENFILMNDDFFITRKTDTVGTYHRGTLSGHIDMIKVSLAYREMLEETKNVLEYLDYPEPLSYELHVPMVMTKHGLSKVIRTVGLWRSLYGNMYNIGGERHDDVKVHNHVNLDIVMNSPLPYISTNDATFQGVLDEYLKDAFPNPSKYEKSPQ